MPYVSDKQRGYFHAQRGKKVPASVVDEFDAAEENEKDPKVKRKKKINNAFLKRLAQRKQDDEEQE